MNLVVVGDSLLDIDLVGTASRLCPDAPAPVLDLEHERVRPGGAALAAYLAAADGVPVTLVTCVAGDPDGERLREALAGLPAVIGPAGASTPVKTRLIACGRSIARVDRGGRGEPPSVTGDMLDALASADAVLVSDYGRGLAADDRLRRLLRTLGARVPVVWDPHPRGPKPVAGVDVATPNLAEATGATGLDGGDFAVAGQAAAMLRSRWEARGIAVTLGGRGALVLEDGLPYLIPARPVLVTDPCGAGDRFASVLAARLMAGDGAIEATRVAVDRSARFLAEGGVSSIGAKTGDEPPISLTAIS